MGLTVPGSKMFPSHAVAQNIGLYAFTLPPGQHPAGGDLRTQREQLLLHRHQSLLLSRRLAVFRAFPLLQRVSHFCNTISTSSTLPRAAVAGGLAQIARRLRWHRSIDPLWICRTSVTPVPLGSRIKRDGTHDAACLAAPLQVEQDGATRIPFLRCNPPKGVGNLLVQVRMGRKERRK